MSKPFFKVTSDFTDDFNAVIKKFKRDVVLVGIPEEEAPRDEANAGNKVPSQINNAALLAINNFGSPINNIPARPVMQIGIKNAQVELIEIFKEGAKRALEKGAAALTTAYNRAGIIASNSIKKAINSQEGLAPPAKATLEAREADGFKGTKTLIVTGQLRNAITYVVKE